MRLGTLLAAAVVAPALVLLGGPAHATTTFTVTGTSDPSPTPTCAGTVCPSLRAAVEAANSNSDAVIELGSATYQLSQDDLKLTASVLITGAGATSTTIEQTGSFGIIDTSDAVSDPAVSIEDLTLTGGHAAYVDNEVSEGGAILNGLGPMTLTRVTVTGNSVTGGSDPSPAAGPGAHGGVIWGGAIVSQGPLTLVSSTVSNNSAHGGTGQSGDPAGTGGKAVGTIMAIGPLTVTDSTFAHNVVTGGDGGTTTSPNGSGGDGGSVLGGAVYAESSLTVRGSTFVDNQAIGGAGSSSSEGGSGAGGWSLGAAIFADSAELEIVNSTFVHNIATAGVGGSGGTPGADGTALGGAVYTQDQPDRTSSTSLASDTFVDNEANGSATAAGGNLALDAAGPASIGDSIIEGGVADGSGANCDLADGLSVTGPGHNLEDTTPSQCGLVAAKGDLIGESAELGPLADNGGPTRTMLPAVSSPVIGAGGTCPDPTSDPALPLTVDQRGAPRPSGRPCDIGAVQLPIPLNTKPPAISPSSPVAGLTATCNPGTFVGDGAVTYDYAWTSAGSPVGQNQATYPVTIADIGRNLRCTVVAHGPDYSSPPVTSAPRTVVPPTPVISALTQSHTTWRIPAGTTFRFSLSESSTVTLSFTRVTSRRLVNGRCVPLTSANRWHPKCATLYQRAGSLTRSEHAGANGIYFTGRVSTGLYLHPGYYVVTFTAKNRWGKVSRPAKLRFTIVD